MNKFMQLFNKLLDFIYKKKCYFCGSSKECVKMCSKCYQELTFSELAPNRNLNGINIYSAGVYEKYLQKMIRGIKYHRQKELAYYMAKFMWEYFRDIKTKYNLPEFEVIPIPMHKSRMRKRGYNHMNLVAEEFCKLSGYKLNCNLAERIKATKPQYKLSRTEKIKNLENAFKVHSENYSGSPLLIIDDICTSGATFMSMIDELRRNEIHDITCFSASSPE